MTAIPGVRVTGKLVPTDSTDVYAVTDPIYGIDGWRGVANAAERNAITTERRREGMIAYQEDTDQLWQLNAGPWLGTDADWTLRSFGGAPGGANQEVQFNDSGAFGADSRFTFDKTTGVAHLSGLTFDGGAGLSFDTLQSTSIVANTDDLNPNGNNYLVLNCGADADLTGIDPTSYVGAVVPVLITNVGAFTLTLRDQSGSSAVGNRFQFGGTDLILAPDTGCILLYDPLSSVWRLLAASSLPGMELRKVRTVTTGTTTLGKNDHHVNLDASGGNITLNIPTATSVASGSLQKVYNLKRVDTSANSVTVNRSGGDTFVIFPPGSTSFTMGPNGDAIKLVGDAANSRWTGE